MSTKLKRHQQSETLADRIFAPSCFVLLSPMYGHSKNAVQHVAKALYSRFFYFQSLRNGPYFLFPYETLIFETKMTIRMKIKAE